MAVSNPTMGALDSASFASRSSGAVVAQHSSDPSQKFAPSPQATRAPHDRLDRGATTAPPQAAPRAANPASHVHLPTPAIAAIPADRDAAIRYIAKLQASIFAKQDLPTKLPGINGPMLTPGNLGKGEA